MKLRQFFIYLAAASIVPVQAAPLPDAVSSMLNRQKNVVPAAEISAEERAYLWQDTDVDRRGYIRTVSSIAYANMVNDFASHPLFKKSPREEYVGAVGDEKILLAGVLQEDQYRSTYVFRWGKAQVGLTVFKFQAAGVRPVVAEEFLQQKVGYARATLALAVAKGTGRGVWKMGWMNGGVDYELWVPDELSSSDDPRLDTGTVIKLGETLAIFADRKVNNIGR